MNPFVNIGIKAVRCAGKILTQHYPRLENNHIIRHSSNKLSLEIEQIIYDEMMQIINQYYPEHQILTANNQTKPVDLSEMKWCIDALSGTRNYINQFPYFCSSVALLRKDKAIMGIVYDPFRQEMFIAADGEGSKLNDQRIRSRRTLKIEEALLATDLSESNASMSSFRHFRLKSEGVKANNGSTALSLAYVACGRLDGYWAKDLSLADLAAGSIIVRESGALITDFLGEQNHLAKGEVITAGPKIFSQLSPYFISK